MSQLQNTRWIFSWENARLFTVNFIAVKTSDVLPSHCESKSFVIKVIWKISTAWTSNWVYTGLFLLFESKIKKNNLVIFYSNFFLSRVNCQTLPFLFSSWMAGCIEVFCIAKYFADIFKDLWRFGDHLFIKRRRANQNPRTSSRFSFIFSPQLASDEFNNSQH